MSSADRAASAPPAQALPTHQPALNGASRSTNIAGNHDASPFGVPTSEGKEVNWWFRKWADPIGERAATSGVDPAKRPYPIDGTWERYTFKVGNVR
jgi:hypothetical protein